MVNDLKEFLMGDVKEDSLYRRRTVQEQSWGGGGASSRCSQVKMETEMGSVVKRGMNPKIPYMQLCTTVTTNHRSGISLNSFLKYVAHPARTHTKPANSQSLERILILGLITRASDKMKKTRVVTALMYNFGSGPLTAAAMRTPEKGPRKAPNVAAITKTYRVICCSKLRPLHQQQPLGSPSMLEASASLAFWFSAGGP